jgi:GDP-L-fucose synthase
MQIHVTGARGFLGSHVVTSLGKRGVEVRPLGRRDGDLRDPAVAERLLADADTIIHLAADVGGVGYLRSCAGRAFHDNFQLGLNVIRAACRGRARRVVLAGTPCAYSGSAPLPLREAALFEGVPSGDTGSYGYAKLASSIAAATICSMAGRDTVTVIPSNLYGPGDTFDTDRGHVVAALVRKALLAVERGQATFDVWGDGSATRDFVYVGDVAEGIATIALEDRPFGGESFNLGSGRETSIAEIAEAVARAVGPGLRPSFLADKPVGYTRRVMSVERAAEAVGYQASTTLAAGLTRTVDWLRTTGRVAAWLEAEREKQTIPLAPRRDPLGEDTSGTRAA